MAALDETADANNVHSLGIAYRGPAEALPTLKGGGGGGTSSGMEARVAVLEAHMENVRKDVSDLKKDVGEVKVQLATLTERVAHLPGKGFIVTASLSIMAVVAAATAFQGQIQQLLHLAPVK